MGYETHFSDELTIQPIPTSEHRAYLEVFLDTRKMRRDVTKLGPDPLREAVGLPVGFEGAFYVGDPESDGFRGSKIPSVIDHNSPPGGSRFRCAVPGDFSTFGELPRPEGYVPSLWCGWSIGESTPDSFVLGADDGKNHEVQDWLRYLIENFFVPWGYKLNGTVEWSGEEDLDLGRMVVKDSVLRVQQASVTYEDVS